MSQAGGDRSEAVGDKARENHSVGVRGSWKRGNRMGRKDEPRSGRSSYSWNVLRLGVVTLQKEQKLSPKFVINGA